MIELYSRRSFLRVAHAGLVFIPMRALCADENAGLKDAFSEAITAIGTLRKNNKSTGIDIASYFADLIKKYSIGQFERFLEVKYGSRRIKDWSGNSVMIDIAFDDLRDLDSNFIRNDSIRVVFIYDTDWKNISRFVAYLGNGSL